MPQIIVIPMISLGLGILGWMFWPEARPWLQVILLVDMLAILAFFRDPDRKIPVEPDILLAPADGKITDIVEVEEPEYLQGPAIRIGIFLSVFDVHINRAPCSGTVAYIQEHPGKCVNALNSEAASEENQATCLGMLCSDHPAGKVKVKQITGAIARRIVCKVRVGEKLAAGQRYGMIKFGSRTELYLPCDNRVEVLVKKGDSVRAGTTIMVRYTHRV